MIEKKSSGMMKSYNLFDNFKEQVRFVLDGGEDKAFLFLVAD